METGNILAGFRGIAKDINDNWRVSDYAPEFRSDLAQLRHAFTHTVKAMGKIATRIDHIEYRSQGAEVDVMFVEMNKAVADIIRCTVRMSIMMGIDAGNAYVDRAEQLAARWAKGQQPPGDTDRETMAVTATPTSRYDKLSALSSWLIKHPDYDQTHETQDREELRDLLSNLFL